MEQIGDDDMEYYLLERDNEYQIITCMTGSDPLYGYGSWSLAAGPFDTWEATDNYYDEMIGE